MRRVRVEYAFGFPVVTAKNYLEVIDCLGIKPWPRTGIAGDLQAFLDDPAVPASQKGEARRFAPKLEVVTLEQPNGSPFVGVRKRGKDWATTVAILPGDLIPFVAEFKHGAERITIAPPSGVPNKEDHKERSPMTACAKREFEEETGIVLEGVIPLSVYGSTVSGRQETDRYYPFIGTVATLPDGSPELKAPNPDKTEHMRVILMRVSNWLKLLADGELPEDCAVSATFLALLKLGRLRLIDPPSSKSGVYLVPGVDI